MKEVELHIPVEQYGFVAVRLDEATPEAAAEIYRDFAAPFKPQEGIPGADFQEFLIQQCLQSGTNHIDTYTAMSEKQKWCVQELKKALATIKRRQAKQ